MKSVVAYGLNCWENRIARSDTFAASELSRENRQMWRHLVRQHIESSPAINKLFAKADLATDQYLVALQQDNTSDAAQLRERLRIVFAKLRKACGERHSKALSREAGTKQFVATP